MTNRPRGLAADDPINWAIGEKLRAARDETGWRRSDVLEKLEFPLHIKSLEGYERGIIRCPNSTFIDLCEVYGKDPADVFAEAYTRAEESLPRNHRDARRRLRAKRKKDAAEAIAEKNRRDEDRLKLANDLKLKYEAGASPGALGTEYGVSENKVIALLGEANTKIRTRLDTANLPSLSRLPKHVRVAGVKRTELMSDLKRWKDAGATIAELAFKLGRSRAFVRDLLEEA